MRISDQTRYLNLVSQYNSLVAQQVTVQTQISGGKRILTADQDPLSAGLAQSGNAQDDRLTQDLTNVGNMTSFSQLTGNSIDSVLQQLQHAQELAINAGDSSKSPSDLADLSAQVDQTLQSVVDLGNTQVNGQYLFSGAKTNQPAFQTVTDATGQITSVVYQGDGGTLQAEYAPGKQAAYNTLGSNTNGGQTGVFQDVGSGVDVFQTLIQLRDDINSNPQNLATDLQSLTAVVAHVSTAIVQNGAAQQTLNGAADSETTEKTELEVNLSKLQDTDVATAATQLTSLQTAYQATLAMGAKVGNMSLLDYLQ